MSKLERLWDDVIAFHANAKEFTGEFLYEPFGVESTPLLNAVTLYAILAVLAFAVYRVSRPAPQPRVRHQDNKYDFGRNV